MKSLFNLNIFINRIKFISNSNSILKQLTFASSKISASNGLESLKSGDLNINNKLTIIFGGEMMNLLKLMLTNTNSKYINS